MSVCFNLRRFLNIYCKASFLVVVNSFSFCLSGNFLSFLWFWSTTLLGILSWQNLLFVCFLVLSLYHATPIWPAKYPLKIADSIMGFLYLTSVVVVVFFPHLRFFLVFSFWHFKYNVSWFGFLCVHPIWKTLDFLDLHICFLPQV